MARITLDACLDKFKSYIAVSKTSKTYKYLEELYEEAEAQSSNSSSHGIPILIKKNNFPSVYSDRLVNPQYGLDGNADNAFNTLVGWLVALQLSELRPNIRNHVLKAGYEMGGYTQDSNIYGWKFECDPNVMRIVAGAIYASMRGTLKPDTNAMRTEVGGKKFSKTVQYYNDSNVEAVGDGDFFINFRNIIPSAAGPYLPGYTDRPAHVIHDAKDSYKNTQVDAQIHEYIVKTYNLDTKDKSIYQKTVQAIADKDSYPAHMFGPARSTKHFSFNPTFGMATIGTEISPTSDAATFARTVVLIASHSREIMLRGMWYGRLRPGCSWTRESMKHSSTNDKENVLTNFEIEDGDGSPTGYYDTNGQWVVKKAGITDPAKWEEYQKNKLTATSFPSGHSAGSMGAALFLMELMPDRADKILRAANQYAINRTICRYHWTSDTINGRVIATAAIAVAHATSDYESHIKTNDSWKSYLIVINKTGNKVKSTGEIFLKTTDGKKVSISLQDVSTTEGARYVFPVGESHNANVDVKLENGKSPSDNYNGKAVEKTVEFYNSERKEASECGWEVTLATEDERCYKTLNKTGATYVIIIGNKDQVASDDYSGNKRPVDSAIPVNDREVPGNTDFVVNPEKGATPEESIVTSTPVNEEEEKLEAEWREGREKLATLELEQKNKAVSVDAEKPMSEEEIMNSFAEKQALMIATIGGISDGGQDTGSQKVHEDLDVSSMDNDMERVGIDPETSLEEGRPTSLFVSNNVTVGRWPDAFVEWPAMLDPAEVAQRLKMQVMDNVSKVLGSLSKYAADKLKGEIGKDISNAIAIALALQNAEAMKEMLDSAKEMAMNSIDNFANQAINEARAAATASITSILAKGKAKIDKKVNEQIAKADEWVEKQKDKVSQGPVYNKIVSAHIADKVKTEGEKAVDYAIDAISKKKQKAVDSIAKKIVVQELAEQKKKITEQFRQTVVYASQQIQAAKNEAAAQIRVGIARLKAIIGI